MNDELLLRDLKTFPQQTKELKSFPKNQYHPSDLEVPGCKPMQSVGVAEYRQLEERVRQLEDEVVRLDCERLQAAEEQDSSSPADLQQLYDRMKAKEQESERKLYGAHAANIEAIELTDAEFRAIVCGYNYAVQSKWIMYDISNDFRQVDHQALKSKLDGAHCKGNIVTLKSTPPEQRS